MNVKRIVANIAVDDVARAKAFYGEVLGLDVAMDLGWVATFAAPTSSASPIISERGH